MKLQKLLQTKSNFPGDIEKKFWAENRLNLEKKLGGLGLKNPSEQELYRALLEKAKKPRENWDLIWEILMSEMRKG